MSTTSITQASWQAKPFQSQHGLSFILSSLSLLSLLLLSLLG
jgi:hypothetical protein